MRERSAAKNRIIKIAKVFLGKEQVEKKASAVIRLSLERRKPERKRGKVN